MKKKTIEPIPYIIVASVIIIGVLLVWGLSGSDSGSAEYSASALVAAERSFDFQTVSMKDGKVSHEFQVRNNGESPVNVTKVYTSCMCTAAVIIDSSGKRYGIFGMQGHGGSSRVNIEVAPGESVVVEAIFDPAAHGPSGVGLVRRSIYLETNSAKSPKLEFSFQAMVTQ